MDDDFGTPEAVAVLFELANSRINAGEKRARPQLARARRRARPCLQRDPQEFPRQRVGRNETRA